MSRFVSVIVDPASVPAGRAELVLAACPVDIFDLGTDGDLRVISENQDECILCGRCVALVPEAVAVSRLYGSEARLVPAGGSDD